MKKRREEWIEQGFLRSEDKIARFSYSLELPRVIRYLKDHESEKGGFSLVPELHPNVEDTYYAIRTLQLLDADFDRRKIEKFLKSINWSNVSLPRTVYWVVYLHLCACLELPSPLLDLLKKDWSRFHPLDAQYFFNEILKLLNQPLKPLSPSSLFQFHRQDNLQSLQKKVSILLDLKIDFDKQEIIRWVRLCQNGDGGFGFYPGTTSYMENIYCALEILSKLHASPWRVDACREYIVGCQTKSGGFGRAPISFPFIDSTFQAVSGLFMLDEMERGNR